MKNKLTILFITVGMLFSATAVLAKRPVEKYKLHIKPVKVHSLSMHHLRGLSAVKSANRKAMQQPQAQDYINSIMTYNFIPGALYKVYCAPLSVTDIELQAGEHIVSVAGGDTLRWQVSKTYSGTGAERREHILVKPTDSGLSNMLVITTDQRTYHLLLHATETTSMAGVQWRYPQDNSLVKDYSKNSTTGIPLSDQSISLNKLNFGYQMKIINDDDKPAWFPKTVFNNGRKTFIQFPSNLQELPTLFVGGLKTGQVVNYRVEGNYFVLDGVFNQMQLRSGQNNQQVVLITRRK